MIVLEILVPAVKESSREVYRQLGINRRGRFVLTMAASEQKICSTSKMELRKFHRSSVQHKTNFVVDRRYYAGRTAAIVVDNEIIINTTGQRE